MAGLDRDRVLVAGLALADRLGVEQLSLRPIAQRLGVTPMALYRHVKDKDDMLDGMAELMYAQLDLPDSTRDWWNELAALAHSVRELVLAHPAALALFARPPAGPNALRMDEALAATLRQAGFTAREAGELHEQLSAIVFALVVPELAGQPNRARFTRGLALLHDGLLARLAR